MCHTPSKVIFIGHSTNPAHNRINKFFFFNTTLNSHTRSHFLILSPMLKYQKSSTHIPKSMDFPNPSSHYKNITKQLNDQSKRSKTLWVGERFYVTVTVRVPSEKPISWGEATIFCKAEASSDSLDSSAVSDPVANPVLPNIDFVNKIQICVHWPDIAILHL